jgi:hypothetical protein
MNDLAVASGVGLDEHVAVDEGFPVGRVLEELGVVAVHEVELAINERV